VVTRSLKSTSGKIFAPGPGCATEQEPVVSHSVVDLEHEPFPSLPAVDSPFFSRELFARAMEPRVLRQVVSELCERELLEKGTLSHAPIEERVETGLSDDEYLIALAIHLSPQEFATDFESDYLAHDIVPDSQAIPAGCVSPVVPFHFTFPDEVIREKAEFKCLERELEKLRESLIAEHLKKHPNDDRTQAELQTRRDYYQTEREKMQSFLDTEQLPPISKQAMFIWMDWVYALDGKITPRILKAARHYLRELVEKEVSQIEAAINDETPNQRIETSRSSSLTSSLTLAEPEGGIHKQAGQSLFADTNADGTKETRVTAFPRPQEEEQPTTEIPREQSYAERRKVAEEILLSRQMPEGSKPPGMSRTLIDALLSAEPESIEENEHSLLVSQLAGRVWGSRNAEPSESAVNSLSSRTNNYFRRVLIPLRIEKLWVKSEACERLSLVIQEKSDWESARKRGRAQKSAET